MADLTRKPHDDPDLPQREALDYVAGTLSPLEREALESHLPHCAECRQVVEFGPRLLPEVDTLLISKPPLKTELELLAKLDRAQEGVDREASGRLTPDARNWRLGAPLFSWR